MTEILHKNSKPVVQRAAREAVVQMSVRSINSDQPQYKCCPLTIEQADLRSTGRGGRARTTVVYVAAYTTALTRLGANALAGGPGLTAGQGSVAKLQKHPERVAIVRNCRL